MELIDLKSDKERIVEVLKTFDKTKIESVLGGFNDKIFIKLNAMVDNVDNIENMNSIFCEIKNQLSYQLSLFE